MAATITRARIRYTAAEPEEVLPPFPVTPWDPLDVLDPLVDDLERSPFFFSSSCPYPSHACRTWQTVLHAWADAGKHIHYHDGIYLPSRPYTFDS